MLEMVQLSPLNMLLILAASTLAILGIVLGWRHSTYTRKLVRFALSLLLALALFLIFFNRLFPPVSSYVVIDP